MRHTRRHLGNRGRIAVVRPPSAVRRGALPARSRGSHIQTLGAIAARLPSFRSLCRAPGGRLAPTVRGGGGHLLGGGGAAVGSRLNLEGAPRCPCFPPSFT